MKVFVTGATGFVGGHVVRRLLAAGHEVTALVREPERAAALAEEGVRIAKGDVTDKESMRAPMTGAEQVYHIAAWYKIGVRDKTPAAVVNIYGTRNVLELMQELDVPKGVYTSTLAVNSDTGGRLVDESYRFTGTHLTEYDRTKAAAHAVAEDFMRQGLPLVIVQPGLIYGPGDTGAAHAAFVAYLQRSLPLLPRKTAYCWAHVDDVAEAHLLAMERGQPGENYFTCGPPHTFVEGMQVAEGITGVQPPSFVAPPWLLRGASGLMSVVERFAAVPETYSSEYLRASAGVTYLGDNTKAKRVLGWEPRALTAGLAVTLEDEMRRLGMQPPPSRAEA